MAKSVAKSGRRLVLKDGTELENCQAGYAGGFLWCYLHGITLMEAIPIMTDPEKTARITFEYGEMSDLYEGFTQVNFMQVTEYGSQVCLVKAAEV